MERKICRNCNMHIAHPGPCNVNRGCTTGWQQLDQDAVGQGWNWTTSNLDKTSSHSRTRGGWSNLQPIDWYLTYIYVLLHMRQTIGKTWLVVHTTWQLHTSCAQLRERLDHLRLHHMCHLLWELYQVQGTKELWVDAPSLFRFERSLSRNVGSG